jgi:hypothetical protein
MLAEFLPTLRRHPDAGVSESLTVTQQLYLRGGVTGVVEIAEARPAAPALSGVASGARGVADCLDHEATSQPPQARPGARPARPPSGEPHRPVAHHRDPASGAFPQRKSLLCRIRQFAMTDGFMDGANAEVRLPCKPHRPGRNTNRRQGECIIRLPDCCIIRRQGPN